MNQETTSTADPATEGPTATPAPEAPGHAAKKNSKLVTARVLQDCALGRPNDLIELPESEAKAAEKSGLIDSHKDAVSYAARLPKNQR